MFKSSSLAQLRQFFQPRRPLQWSHCAKSNVSSSVADVCLDGCRQLCFLWISHGNQAFQNENSVNLCWRFLCAMQIARERSMHVFMGPQNPHSISDKWFLMLKSRPALIERERERESCLVASFAVGAGVFAQWHESIQMIDELPILPRINRLWYC